MKAQRINIKSETRRMTGRQSVASPLFGYLANCLDGRSKYYDTGYE